MVRRCSTNKTKALALFLGDFGNWGLDPRMIRDKLTGHGCVIGAMGPRKSAFGFGASPCRTRFRSSKFATLQLHPAQKHPSIGLGQKNVLLGPGISAILNIGPQSIVPMTARSKYQLSATRSCQSQDSILCVIADFATTNAALEPDMTCALTKLRVRARH